MASTGKEKWGVGIMKVYIAQQTWLGQGAEPYGIGIGKTEQIPLFWMRQLKSRKEPWDFGYQ